MRLSKLEPEPLLQLDLDLLGNVATKCLGDLWQFDHRLHQQDHGATQTQLPKLYGRQGAHILTHKGVLVKCISDQSTFYHQGQKYYNAYQKDIAIVNIFFGEPTVYGELQYYLNQLKTTNEPCFPEFERLPKMTWLDFISGFGGLCGLCLGMSFVSLAEILYWFSIRLLISSELRT